jgi:hypothetical protein
MLHPERSFTAALRRRLTGSSTTSTESANSSRRARAKSFFQQAVEDEEPAKPQRYQQKYSVYNGMTWNVLEGFLRSKWKDEIFNEIRVGAIDPIVMYLTNETMSLGGRLLYL